MVSMEQYQEVVNKLLEMERRMDEFKKDKKDKWPMTSKRSFLNIPKYGGNPDEFEDWRFKFMTFLREEAGWGEVLKRLDAMTEVPTVDNLKAINTELVGKQVSGIDVEGVAMAEMNRQLFQCLCMNLVDKALAPVKNLWDEVELNGFVSWWRLGQDCLAMTSQRLQGLAGKVYSPKRCKKYVDVGAAIDTWEAAVKIFQNHEKKDLSDPTKIYSVRQIVPDDLERDIIRQSNNLTTYQQVKSYIVEQVSVRRDMRSHGPVPMEVDYAKKVMAMLAGEGDHGEEDNVQGRDDEGDGDGVDGGVENQCQPCGDRGGPSILQDLFSFVKGMKGKGNKGGGKGGKGRFEGNCSHCGVYGHRMNQCWKKDKEMDEWRNGKGKGKSSGEGQKGGYGKGGYPAYGGWKGKGKGKAMNLGWWSDQQSPTPTAWTLSLLTNKDWEQPKKPIRRASCVTPAMKGPPGLGQGFEVLNLEDAMHENDDYDKVNEMFCENAGLCDEVYEKNFPKYKEEIRNNNYHNNSNVNKMGNYSKKQVRLANDAGSGQKIRKALRSPLAMFQKAPLAKPLNPFLAPTPDKEGWVKIKGVMDSGASESVAPPTMCPHYEITPSPGSLAGQEYVSASDDRIPNLGEQVLSIVTSDGKDCTVKYQVADVSRPLNAISEICDAGGEHGQHVIFGKNGGMIVNLETGRQTPFAREDGVYTLEFWVKPTGFARQS